MRDGFWSSNRWDQFVVGLSLLGFVLCSSILFSESLFNEMFGEVANEVSAPTVGTVSFTKNDTRVRLSNSYSWIEANAKQKVHLGDSIFTGKDSFSQVELDEGSKVDLDQNSLVKFSKIDSIEIPNLVLGNFRLRVSGKLKVAIDGEVTEVSGSNAELQVFIGKKGKPSFKLLKGAAQIKTSSLEKTLTVGEVVKLTKSQEPQTAFADLEIRPDVYTKAMNYILKFGDIYEQSLETIRLRQESKIVSVPVKVSWAVTHPTAVRGQLSATPDFKYILSAFSEIADSKSGEFQSATIGKNYFRLSKDGTDWSVAQQLTVESSYLKKGTPALTLKSKTFLILNGSTKIQGSLSSKFSDFVLEMSESEVFSSSSTKVVRLRKNQFSLRTDKPGLIYLRARALSAAGELTGYSDMIRVNVEKRDLPGVPLLVTSDFEVAPRERITLKWTSSRGSEKYKVEIANSDNKIILTRRQVRDSLKLTAPKSGRLRIRIKSEDSFGRESKEFAEARVAIRLKIKESHTGVRLPANAKSSFIFGSKDYKGSIDVEGSVLGMYSSDQVATGSAPPSVLLAGVRWLRWWGSQGIEGSFKHKAANLNSSAVEQASPLQIELRYRRRWKLPLNPFAKGLPFEASWILAYEYYRNSRGEVYSSGYEMFKSGLRLSLPIASAFETGGELLYGMGFDKNSKYEVSGFVDYYLKNRLSVGFGYRIHLIETGAGESTPAELPSREGYGEGFSTFKWRY